jgi:transcriptional regulator with XRE-family HTH domain
LAKKKDAPPVLPWPPHGEEFADRLARLRRLFRRYGRKADAENRAIAQACGVASNTVSNWMSTGEVPKTETLLALARYFYVSPDWLVDGRGSPSRYAPQDPTLKRRGSTGDGPAGGGR